MSRKPAPPVFLQRASYRQRRLRDGAKLVPFLGIVLWAIPLAWRGSGPDEKVGSAGLLYIFGVWVLLIVLTALLSSRLQSDDAATDRDAPNQ